MGGRYPASIRWTARLREMGWQIFNEGENGRAILHCSREAERIAGVIRRSKINAVVVMLGSNDLLQDPNLSAEACAARMEQFLTVLLRQAPKTQPCRFLLVSPPPMRLGPWVQDFRTIEASKQLGNRYRTVARRLGIDFADAGIWDIGLAYDGVHFSEAGHQVFAEQIGALLTALFTKE